ncbi:MAG TPA: SRPBCC family protein [Bacteroidales bacterium]|nr:SRPBCC family protein [Bacteroidales bacterium]HSA43222.1 SRPBCC family protein [Bacteroidales bacterium]
MKALKTIGLIVLIIIALIVIIALFLPRKVHVERSLVINASGVVLFDQVNNLKNWDNWSPWHHLDSAMQVYYLGPPSGEGAVYHWESKNPDVGTGKMIIKKSVPYESVVIDLDFTQSIAEMHMNFNPEGDNVKVVWSMDADMGRNPLKRYLGLFMEKWIAPDFEKGLQNLKDYSEKLPYARLIAEPADVAETFYVSIRDTSSMATISQKMGAFYGELMNFLVQKKLQPAGSPICLYYSWENNVFDMECAIPVEKAMTPEGRILTGSLKPGKAVRVEFMGPYEQSGFAHMVAEQWLTKNNKNRSGAPWERYVTDPMAEPDPSKWLTEVYWPFE